MTLSVVLLGVMAGLGVLCIVVGLMRRPEPAFLLEEPERLGRRAEPEPDGKKRSLRATLRRAAGLVERDLHSKALLIQDAKMMGRPLETHALHKMGGLVLGVALLAAVGLFLDSVLALDLPPMVIVAIALVGGLLGWLLPDSMLRTEANKERAYFQQAAEAWLELVAQLVTAGSDTFAALITAASYSEQPVFVTIREALRVAAVSGEPPWTGLRRLADERRLRFLDPFCSALELAGTTGAGSRQAILAQVEAARSKSMQEADAAAASSGEKMGAPLALIGGAFMILMGYPPLAGIMDTSTLTSL